MLVEEIKDNLPNIKIMILEPFILKECATKDNWEYFRNEVEQRAEVCKKVAEKNKLVFVPLMEAFDKAAEAASEKYWLIDGVHPTAMGHEIIKNEWIKNFRKLKL